MSDAGRPIDFDAAAPDGGSLEFGSGTPSLEERLRARAAELGFSLFGIAAPDPSEHVITPIAPTL